MKELLKGLIAFPEKFIEFWINYVIDEFLQENLQQDFAEELLHVLPDLLFEEFVENI